MLVHGLNHCAGAVAGAITLLHNVLQVSTCFLKDREVCFANNLFYMVFGISTRSRGRCAGSDHVGGRGGEGSERPVANERTLRTIPATVHIGTQVTPWSKVQPVRKYNSILVYVTLRLES